MLFNWIPSIAILMTLAIVKRAKMVMLVIMGTIMMANINFSLAIRGIQLKGIQNSLVMLYSYELDLFY